MELAIAILAGLLIGSFLNVCIFRMPRDLSVVHPRSFCPPCVMAAEEAGVPFEDALRQGMIPWYDNIPVLSWLFLRGRCRRCKARISWRYPVVELLTAVAFAACVAAFGLTLLALKYAIYSAIMIALSVTDIEERILPDEFTLGGILIGLGIAWFVPMPPDIGRLFFPFTWSESMLSVGESAVGAGVSAGLLLGLGWLYEKVRGREGMGLGDVKMIGTIGAFLGLGMTLMTLVFASLLGSVLGGLFILATRKKAGTYELPFGSFLGISALAAAAYIELFVKSLTPAP